VCTNLPADAISTKGGTKKTGVALERWFGMILSYHGFNITDKTTSVKSKDGEFFLAAKISDRKINSSMFFFKRLLQQIASASKELSSEWLEYISDKTTQVKIKNYILYKSFDTEKDPVRRIDNISLPEDIVDR
jgi:hypothetical protein